MTAGALSSDHVNYLIFRYLQEAGHEHAATAFHRDWHRQPEFRDPENYPFAGLVQRNELITLIQSGLHHDEIEARVRKDQRRFQFTHATAREGVEGERRRESGGVLENGAVGSRPTSSGANAKGKGRILPLRPPQDEFPTPLPKRQRTSDGNERLHLNGDPSDTMDVDTASPNVDADDDTASPIASDVEIVEVYAERNDSMELIHAAVQTESYSGPKTTTMYLKIDKPGAMIYHCQFEPVSDGDDPKGRNALLAVGEGLCRFFQVPEDFEVVKQVMHTDEPSIPPKAVITASAWQPDGRAFSFAVDSVRDLPDGRQVSQQMVFRYDCETKISSPYHMPSLLQPPGVVLALRYSNPLPSGQFLAILCTNLKRSLLLIYQVKKPGETDRDQPIAWRMLEQEILDVQWDTSGSLYLCGENGFGEECGLLDVQPPSQPDMESLTLETVSIHGLWTKEWTNLRKESDTYTWDKVSCGPQAGIVALVSIKHQCLAIVDTFNDATEPIEESIEYVDLPGHLTAMVWQPQKTPGPTDDPLLLAVAFEEGTCVLYCYKRDCQIDELHTLHLNDGPILALAWSPGGAYLAVGGVDAVQIWETAAVVRRNVGQYRTTLEKVGGAASKPLVTWRRDYAANGARNGEHQDDERPLSEPSLSWSADGESLAFALDKQISIIRFRPRLGSIEEHGEVNGHAG